MDSRFHAGNRDRFYRQMEPASALVMFAGEELRKTNDEYYLFYADRSFVYMTGIEQKQTVLLAVKDASGAIHETLYILRSDPMAERWTGVRLQPQEAEFISGVSDIRTTDAFPADWHRLATQGYIGRVYLDLYRASPDDLDRPAHRFHALISREHPYLTIGNANAILRTLRLIKQPCELEAMRRAEDITRDGIMAMMHASRPGMYEYQYKAEFDRAIGQYGPQGPAFPSIISAGRNNFCIHYYAYRGQAQDGDMVLNDVGGQWDNVMTDVSRGWPCNGRYTDRQKLLFNCALETSNHMFSIIRPGMKMADVDGTIRSYNAQLLKDAGVLDDVKNVGRLMWHGGAHHVGYDVHDVVAVPEAVAPGMVFCIDVGIYHEEWGIGFRLEDNCLVTEAGCENLSRAIPRTVEDIEAEMHQGLVACGSAHV